jgi:hypothetical protein
MKTAGLNEQLNHELTSAADLLGLDLQRLEGKVVEYTNTLLSLRVYTLTEISADEPIVDTLIADHPRFTRFLGKYYARTRVVCSRFSLEPGAIPVVLPLRDVLQLRSMDEFNPEGIGFRTFLTLCSNTPAVAFSALRRFERAAAVVGVMSGTRVGDACVDSFPITDFIMPPTSLQTPLS